MYEYGALLVRVIDADTWILDIDLGLHVWMCAMHVRAAGLNAPELSTDAGKAAKAWAESWFIAHCPEGALTVRTQRDRNDNYGRLLGTVIAPDSACLNNDLLAAAQAVPYP